MVAHLLAVSLPLTVGFVAFSNYSFFSWHPFLMSIAFSFAMAEGILVFSRESSLFTGKPYSTKVNLHGYVLFTALLSALSGFWVIWANKNANGYGHFLSWHAYLGLITVIYACVQVPAGVFLKYAPSITPKGFPVPLVRFAHGLSGFSLFLLATTTFVLGLQTIWFTTNANYYVWGGTSVAAVLLAAAICNQLTALLQRQLKAKSAAAGRSGQTLKSGK